MRAREGEREEERDIQKEGRMRGKEGRRELEKGRKRVREWERESGRIRDRE